MSGDLVNRLRSLAGIIPQKHTLPSGADTVICSLEAFLQIKELAKDAAYAIEELSKRVPPVPHGRLIDADALYLEIKAECNPYGKPSIGYDDGLKVLGLIGSTPPVIPAEPPKEET